MDVRVESSILAFGREAWNALFPGELEDFDYYRAAENAGLRDFEWLYVGIWRDGRLVAAAPAFLTDYELDTTLRGPLRRVTDALSRVFPRLLRQRLLSLGSPVAETCAVGFAADLGGSERVTLFEALLDALAATARTRRAAMLAAKDAPASQDALFAQHAGARGLRRQPGLPTAFLDLPFATLDDYFKSLSRATRKDLKRKLHAAGALRVEWRDNIDDISDDVMRLYEQTYARAELSFEELTPDYFRNVLRECRGRALCATYWHDGRLVAFNLVLHDGTRLIDKFLGMDYAVSRELNLYFVSWIENVRWCLDHGIRLYQSGQGLHREKLRLGSRLGANWLWYRHRNPLLDRLFALGERLFRLDRFDAELAALNPPAAAPAPATVSASARRRALAAWVGLLSCEMLCQVALKLAGRDVGAFEFTPDGVIAALRSPWLWTAIGTYVGGFFSWMQILRAARLSAAFPTSAIVFVGVMFSSWLVLGEPVSWRMLAGAALIVGGILLLGDDDAPAEVHYAPGNAPREP